MAEKPDKWSREQGFFHANSADILTIVIAVLCGAIFIVLLMTQLNMPSLVEDYFKEQAASQPPIQPDIPSKPGETGMYLYPSQPAPAPKKQ
jgi:hypothetical protein